MLYTELALQLLPHFICSTSQNSTAVILFKRQLYLILKHVAVGFTRYLFSSIPDWQLPSPSPYLICGISTRWNIPVRLPNQHHNRWRRADQKEPGRSHTHSCHLKELLLLGGPRQRSVSWKWLTRGVEHCSASPNKCDDYERVADGNYCKRTNADQCKGNPRSNVELEMLLKRYQRKQHRM